MSTSAVNSFFSAVFLHVVDPVVTMSAYTEISWRMPSIVLNYFLEFLQTNPIPVLCDSTSR